MRVTVSLEEIVSEASMSELDSLEGLIAKRRAVFNATVDNLAVEEQTAIFEGQPIMAIKMLRERTEVGLLEAKRVCDAFREKNGYNWATRSFPNDANDPICPGCHERSAFWNNQQFAQCGTCDPYGKSEIRKLAPVVETFGVTLNPTEDFGGSDF